MSNADDVKCFVCQQDATARTEEHASPYALVSCKLCGQYRIIWGTLEGGGHLREDDSHFVMCAIRNLTEKGTVITFARDTVEKLRTMVHPPETPIDTIHLLLEHTSRRTNGKPGGVAKYDPMTDYPLLFAQDPEEMLFHIESCELAGLSAVSKTLSSRSVRITVEGWQRLHEIGNPRPDSRQAFVAMWFDAQMNEAFTDGIYKALEQTGYVPFRVDLTEHNNKICDEIAAGIRNSGLMVVDLTGHRGGAYFEAGMALGLGIPVIWTCRKDQSKDAHFDIRQYNRIEWSTPKELREKLVHRIEATAPLGTGS